MINSLILILSLITMIIMGVPIAVAIGMTSIIVFIIGGYPLHIFPQFLIATASNWTLLAVPFFIIAGSFMNEFGITERLFKFARVCVGRTRGGLAHVNVVASMIFAGISGSSVADVAGLGKVELKAMDDAGYNKRISIGVTLASSVVGPIIPPSISFILYGVIANVSIAKLFLAGIIPGIIICISLMSVNYILALKFPGYFPEERKTSFQDFLPAFKAATFVIMAPILILLGMTSGYISPTEAGAGACFYSIFVGIIYRAISLNKIWRSVKTSMLQAANAMLLVSVASVMGYILTFERVPQTFTKIIFVNIAGGNVWIVLLLIDLLFLLIGCFMSGTAALIILTPILLPMIIQAGIDPLHFGIIICYGLVIGIATPPVGIGLYIISDIADVKLEETIVSVLPYLVPLIISLFIITYIPQLSLWLPNLLMK